MLNVLHLEPDPLNWKKRITLDCQLTQGNLKVAANAMVDSGATGLGFISRQFAQEHGFLTTPLDRYIDLFGFDGTRVLRGRITHVVRLQLEHDSHLETISLFVTTLGKHRIILGFPWMKRHKIIPDWRQQKLRFTSGRCQRHLHTNKRHDSTRLVPT